MKHNLTMTAETPEPGVFVTIIRDGDEIIDTVKGRHPAGVAVCAYRPGHSKPLALSFCRNHPKGKRTTNNTTNKEQERSNNKTNHAKQPQEQNEPIKPIKPINLQVFRFLTSNRLTVHA